MTYIAKYRLVRLLSSLATLAALTVMSGCKSLDIENLNGVSTDALEKSPTPLAINAGAQNLLSAWRSVSSGHASDLAKYGYETWQIRASEPRTLTNVVSAPKTGGYWNYITVKNIYLLLDAVNTVAGMTAEQKEGLRGWLKTNLAVQFEDMAQAHDSFGIVLDLPANPLDSTPAKIETKQVVWSRIFTLLDEAYTHLGAAGTAFSFKTNTGWAGFNTPTTFRRVNRALYAKYKILYATPATGHGQSGPASSSADPAWNQALTAIGQTWINEGATTLTQLNVGPFHVNPAGEGTNTMSAADRYINDRFRLEAQCKALPCTVPANAGDTTTAVVSNRDNRAWGATAKARPVANFSFASVNTRLKQTDYFSPSQTATIGTQANQPLMRNEELILLRAEIYYNLGQTANAIADLNRIRVNRGGLPALADPYVPNAALGQPATLLEELLYEKRMSMWAENATVWLDMRHYGMANMIPHYLTEFRIFDIFPIPNDECIIRGFSTKGCFEGGYQGISDGPVLGAK
ncbi:MAG: RagB/SusD family nutrient uptake outer membrane protein [Gemmatimonadetes bacterium]|nr:RagB/SusD family nutrient uptake outer membrane protein [Gemmatimonadota bacterium]